MVFTSAIFIFCFLPLFLGLYYAVPVRFRSYVILIGSYIFYGWWRLDFLGLLIAVTLVNYQCARFLTKHNSPLIISFGVGFNLAVLGVFKYFNFGIESLNAVLAQSGINTLEALSFILPIGISFYIFQSISFLIDVARGDAMPPRRFIDFAAFIALFPQLIAGPVLRFKDMASQFENRVHSFGLFSEGARRFMIGFCKKVLIADTVAPIVDDVFAIPNPTLTESWLGALSYTVQLYFDFSGYSDMAIGLGLMMGFRFIENFNTPYISQSITEFWRRWHISLSTWLRDYLYIPLGGSRGGPMRTSLNVMITMTLGGLWHGANWTFLFWGMFHGAFMVVERRMGIKGNSDGPISWVRVLMTFLLVVLGWVLFRAEHIYHALNLYEGMFGFNGFWITDYLSWQLRGLSLTMLAIGLLAIFANPFKARALIFTLHPAIVSSALIILFIMAVLRVLAQSYSPFLYFQF